MMVRVSASSSTVASADNAAFRATASRVGTHAVPGVRTSPAPASPPCDRAQGLDVSLFYILENLILQRRLRHRSLEFRVLPLQFFLSFRLIQLQGAVFLLPAVVRPHGDFNFLAGSRVVFPFAIPPSICRSSVTVCSTLYLLMDMT